eukprot:SAG31_NODE_8308_length_1477_cov_1.172714_2_plen_185_part_00
MAETQLDGRTAAVAARPTVTLADMKKSVEMLKATIQKPIPGSPASSPKGTESGQLEEETDFDVSPQTVLPGLEGVIVPAHNEFSDSTEDKGSTCLADPDSPETQRCIRAAEAWNNLDSHPEFVDRLRKMSDWVGRVMKIDGFSAYQRVGATESSRMKNYWKGKLSHVTQASVSLAASSRKACTG